MTEYTATPAESKALKDQARIHFENWLKDHPEASRWAAFEEACLWTIEQIDSRWAATQPHQFTLIDP